MVAAHLPKVRPGGQIFQWKFPLPPPPEHFSISDAVDSPAHEAYHHYFKHTHLSEEKTRHYLSVSLRWKPNRDMSCLLLMGEVAVNTEAFHH